MPFDFHRSIIGQKGRDVRELMDTYDVHIILSPADQKLDIIKVNKKRFCQKCLSNYFAFVYLFII